MKIIVDARSLTLYPVGRPGFTGGTELMIRVLASGLAGRGHTVHVVTPDLDEEEQRGPTEWWWSPNAHPTRAEVLVVCPHLGTDVTRYTGDALVLATNGIDPYLGEDGKLAELVAAFPVFSQTHGRMMCEKNPTIDPAKCAVTGLGVDLADYEFIHYEGNVVPSTFTDNFDHLKVPGRLWVGNDPARGLWSVLDTFEIVQAKVPEATLHISYGFDSRFERSKWQHKAIAEMLWECDRRLKTMVGVVNLGQLTRPETVREQIEAMVHLWPSDPPNRGSQIHGISQMEAAAAGCALVLSDIEAFPEVFGDGAAILPVPGKYDPAAESRWDAQDYADVVIELLCNPDKWAEASRKARSLAEQHTWTAVIDRWDQMLTQLVGAEA